jgi:hypothetical protein
MDRTVGITAPDHEEKRGINLSVREDFVGIEHSKFDSPA